MVEYTSPLEYMYTILLYINKTICVRDLNCNEIVFDPFIQEFYGW